MKPSEHLAEFVARALAAGQARDKIAETLQQAGWQPSDIRRALGAWGDSAFGLPVPRPASHVSAADAFFYGLLFTTLAMLVWHINALGFNLIDRMFAITNEYTDEWVAVRQARSIRWSIAVLIVVVPLFLWLNRVQARRVEADPAQSRSAIRKWFGFITLYVAVLGMVGDLIATIYAFLNGDMTVQLLVKSALVMVTAGLVFLYYRSDLRQSDAV